VKVIRLQVGPLQTNCYLVRGGEGPAGAVIDPGGDAGRIVDRCAEEDIRPELILNTHAHMDHIGANGALKDEFPEAELCIGRREAGNLEEPGANLSAMFGIPVSSPPADREVGDGQAVEFGDVVLRVVETPGHTPGHVCFLARDEDPPQLFCGDLVFRGGVGRTDFPGGSTQRLRESIREKVLSLPDETVLWPGHGERTTVGRERRSNPFLT
jgi:glyoxylase-like metal-dependent hydrolase (beta-lactamase superfamily II)